MSKITRRDFVNGTLIAAGSSLLPLSSHADEAMAALSASYYPPARTGLRGSHPGSNEVAHARAWNGQSDWGRRKDTHEKYDLVVVGAGLSGLAAAYFFQREHGQGKKVLVLDNHDDFGGHAKRNEHLIDGVLRLGEGGSESFESPHTFGATMLGLMDELGVDMQRFKTAYDTGFFQRHELGVGSFFNQRVFGEDKLVMHPFCDYPGFVEGLLRPTLSYDEAVAQTPLSASGKQQLLRVLNGGQHVLNLPKTALREYVQSHSWFDYLQNTLGVDDPGVLRMARHTAMDYGEGGTDVMSIAEALASGPLGSDPYDAWPDALQPGEYQEYVNRDSGTYSVRYPFIEHFPDGNATIAPHAGKKIDTGHWSGDNVEEIVLSRFDYSKLDRPANTTRIRLNSTAVKVRHCGDAANSDEVLVDYVSDGGLHRVTAKGVVMAGYNMMIPHIVPNLRQSRTRHCGRQTKVPLQYTTIGLRNWRAIKDAGIGMVMCPRQHSSGGRHGLPGQYGWLRVYENAGRSLRVASALRATG